MKRSVQMIAGLMVASVAVLGLVGCNDDDSKKQNLQQDYAKYQKAGNAQGSASSANSTDSQ